MVARKEGLELGSEIGCRVHKDELVKEKSVEDKKKAVVNSAAENIGVHVSF